jgi:hypothetical protein
MAYIRVGRLAREKISERVKMALVRGETTILGGLPVIMDVDCGYDHWAGEGYSEVNAIYWRKRDGTAGKEIPESVYDRANKYDWAFCDAIERLFDNRRDNEEEPEPPVQFNLTAPSF